LIDPSHPREKPCGGGVTGRALALLPASVFSGVRSVTVTRTVFDRGSNAVAVPLAADGRRDLVVASRAVFDRALLDAAEDAGAHHVPQRVLDLTLDRDSVRISTSGGTMRAGIVVGADGANSLVRRRVAMPFPRDELSIATGWYARDVNSSDIHIGFVDSPAGYIWSFPRPDHLAIGICAQADETTPEVLRARLQTWLRHTGIASNATLERYSWPIPSLSAGALRRAPYGGDRWLLVGDAAGLVDPITREPARSERDPAPRTRRRAHVSRAAE
jgi:flavin-dependent dehydrogenase